MSGSRDKAVRKAAKEASEATARSTFPTVGALIQNEEVTKGRLDALEGAVGGLGALASRPLLGRLKWLLRGK